MVVITRLNVKSYVLAPYFLINSEKFTKGSKNLIIKNYNFASQNWNGDLNTDQWRWISNQGLWCLLSLED